MQTPGVFAGSQYYRVGSNITFGWNYTSLLVTPSHIDILATNTAQPGITHTLAINQTVATKTGSLIWDTEHYPKSARLNLDTGKYTLIIHDTTKDINAVAQAGHLGSFNQFAFGIYNPQPYQDLDDGFRCATCVKSAALRTIAPLLITLLGTLAGAGWFLAIAL